MAGELALLLHLFDEAFEKQSWHGPNLRGSIRGLTQDQASWRPGPGRHNIWEIVVHCAYWKYAVRRRLSGARRGSFPLAGSNWFSRPDPRGGRSWKEDVALLEQEHRMLRETLTRLSSRSLHATAPGKKISNLRMVYGIASHDLYHAGQIQLLKRLRRR